MRKRTGLIAVLVAAIVLGSAAAVSVGVGGRADDTSHDADRRPATATVTRATLVDYVDAPGQLAYGEPVALHYTMPVDAAPADTGSPPTGPAPTGPDSASPGSTGGSGAGASDDDQHVLTWLPKVGAIVDRGEAVFRVDDAPVVLLFGPLPVYRTLKVGVEGHDVKQLEQNLAALGYHDFTVDESFSAATASAVRKWQQSLGLAPTGMVAPGQVIYAPGMVRVAVDKASVGDPADGEILDYTGTARQVTVNLPVDDQQYAGSGTKLTVTLPNGRAVPGTVALIDPAGQDPAAAGGPPTVEVVVAIADQAALDRSVQGAVSVRFVAEERKDVLTVPVVALLALAEGGYGVQVVDGSSTRYVAVTTGLFANGQVEITSGDIRPGMLVVVPR